MVLVTGPAGSGKTTTLYAALNHLSSPTRNIITVEEPVEVRLSNIRQVQADPQAGMPLARALMSVLHQDPDVLLVGEIRDEETARVAAMAAISGRMVLATLCGEDAIGAVASLRDLGVPAMVVRNALMCVIAQRLVGKLCDACAVPENNTEAIASLPAHWQGRGFKRATACRTCGNTGYRGRVGVFEVLNVTPTIQKLIEHDATGVELFAAARAAGMPAMWEDCLEKASRGLASLAEVSKLRWPEAGADGLSRAAA
jgi:type IV pilus assembly protein PilB